MEKFSIQSINISREKGVVKKPVSRALLKPNSGIEGDAHAGPWHRQISLLARERIMEFEKKISREMAPGEFAENLTTIGLDLSRVAVLDRILINDVELEITQIGKECHTDCAIYQEVGACIMPKEGVFARVAKGGEIAVGSEAEFHPRDYIFHVITLSDRAFSGVYPDRSGPHAVEKVTAYYRNTREHIRIDREVIPDEGSVFLQKLQAAVDTGADVIITTGSTGIGPRDIAPQITADFCDRQIPGIMEFARVTFGARKPAALLSCGIAGIKNSTVIFNLPGSVRAVDEYLDLILGQLDHIRRMIHSIDVH